MAVVTRFAPAPTGRLHVGNLRTALHNCLWARKNGGRFLLRIDDTDVGRCEERFVDAIVEDLDWLGLGADETFRQSQRFERYEAALARLAEAGRAYRAWESAQELELKRKVLLSRGLPPIYDRAALELSVAEKARFESDGRRPHWRFRLDPAPIAWRDLVRGEQHFDPASLSDPVIRREDGSWLYMLPSVVDDIEMGVTDVVRGEDHVANSAIQIQMFAALGAAPPAFAHEALLTGAEAKLSKRLGSLGVEALRDAGIEPKAARAKLARIGTSLPVDPALSMETLIETIDFSTFGRAPARFDLQELIALSARIVHALPFEQVCDRLPQGMSEADWLAIRPNLARVDEAGDYWEILHGHAGSPGDEADRPFLALAAEAAGALDWHSAPWPQLVEALKTTSGRSGKALFRPLRLALTGRESGPEMVALLPLIGRDESLRRLRSAAG